MLPEQMQKGVKAFSSCWPTTVARAAFRCMLVALCCFYKCKDQLCSLPARIKDEVILQLFCTSALHKKMIIKVGLPWDSLLEWHLKFKHLLGWKFKRKKKKLFFDISCATNSLTIIKTIAGFKMCYLSETIKTNGPMSTIAARGWTK